MYPPRSRPGVKSYTSVFSCFFSPLFSFGFFFPFLPYFLSRLFVYRRNNYALTNRSTVKTSGYAHTLGTECEQCASRKTTASTVDEEDVLPTTEEREGWIGRTVVFVLQDVIAPARARTHAILSPRVSGEIDRRVVLFTARPPAGCIIVVVATDRR